MKIFRQYSKNISGVSAVEFSLVFPIFVFIFMGTVDAGMFIFEKMKLQNTARVAAEYVALTQDDANIQTVAQEAYEGAYEDVTLSSEFQCECEDGVAQVCPVVCASNDYQRRFVVVTASGDFDAVFAYPGLSDNIPLQSTMRMRVD